MPICERVVLALEERSQSMLHLYTHAGRQAGRQAGTRARKCTQSNT